MSRIWPVVRREYVERVRSKAFLIVTLLAPVLMGAFVILPGVLMEKQRGRALRIAVVDETGVLKEGVERALANQKADGRERFEIRKAEGGTAATELSALREEVLEGRLDGYVRIPEDALKTSQAEYHGKNVSNFLDLSLVQKIIGEALLTHRLVGEGIELSKVRALTSAADLKTLRVSTEGEKEDRGGSFMLAFLMAGMLYTTVVIWGQALMNGVIEEKTNRAVEVMVASIPTSTLFMGKLLGVGAVGLTQFFVWSSCLVLAGVFGGPALAALGFLPEVPATDVVALLVFFVLGYFLYAAFYAAIGASVNTQQEAQSLIFPVLMPLILAFVLAPSVLSNPEGSVSTVLSFIPPLTPILMFARIVAQRPPSWQIGLAIVLLVLTIAVVNWCAARIYRVGILMYGKRPTLPEILRWIRAA